MAILLIKLSFSIQFTQFKKWYNIETYIYWLSAVEFIDLYCKGLISHFQNWKKSREIFVTLILSNFWPINHHYQLVKRIWLIQKLCFLDVCGPSSKMMQQYYSLDHLTRNTMSVTLSFIKTSSDLGAPESDTRWHV